MLNPIPYRLHRETLLLVPLRRAFTASLLLVLAGIGCHPHSAHACSCFTSDTTTAGNCSCAHSHHHALIQEGRQVGLGDGTAAGLEAGTVAAFESRASGSGQEDPRAVYEVPELAIGTDSHYLYGYEAGHEAAFGVSYRAAYSHW